MAQDPFSGMKDQTTTPAKKFITITPSDSVDLTEATRAIYVNVFGNAKLTLISDPIGHTGVVLNDLAVGEHPFAVRRVWATGTTATIVGLG